MNLPPANAPVVSESSSPVAAVGALAGQLALSLGLGIAATIAVAIVWGILANLTDSVYLYAALFAGIAIGGLMLWPLGRANIIVRLAVLAVAGVLTVVAVLGGDYLYYTLKMADRHNLNLLDAAMVVAPNFVEAEQADGLMSILFALAGAVVTLFQGFRRGR